MSDKPAISSGRKPNDEARAKLRAIFEADVNASPIEAAKQAGCAQGLAYEVRRLVRAQAAA